LNLRNNADSKTLKDLMEKSEICKHKYQSMKKR